LTHKFYPSIFNSFLRTFEQYQQPPTTTKRTGVFAQTLRSRDGALDTVIVPACPEPVPGLRKRSPRGTSFSNFQRSLGVR